MYTCKFISIYTTPYDNIYSHIKVMRQVAHAQGVTVNNFPETRCGVPRCRETHTNSPSQRVECRGKCVAESTKDAPARSPRRRQTHTRIQLSCSARILCVREHDVTQHSVMFFVQLAGAN